MKLRILCAVMAMLIAAVCFSACGKTETAEPESTQPESITAEVTDAVEEDGQNPVMNFSGNYQSDRRTMLVEAVGMDEAKVSVHWGADYQTSTEWVLTGKIVEDGDNLVMNYTNGSFAVVTYDEEGNATRSDETNDCTGTVTFRSDYKIVWTDNGDELIKDLVFDYVPQVEE